MEGLTHLGPGCSTQQDDKGSHGTTKENSSFQLRALHVPVLGSLLAVQACGLFWLSPRVGDAGREISLETGSWRLQDLCLHLSPVTLRTGHQGTPRQLLFQISDPHLALEPGSCSPGKPSVTLREFD